jgi:hypothetical protein
MGELGTQIKIRFPARACDTKGAEAAAWIRQESLQSNEVCGRGVQNPVGVARDALEFRHRSGKSTGIQTQAVCGRLEGSEERSCCGWTDNLKSGWEQTEHGKFSAGGLERRRAI